MTTRILPTDEWPRLAALDIAQMLPLLDRDDIQIVVVEDGERIVACWSVLRIVHFEGLWVDPEYRRKPRLARSLVTATVRAALRWTRTIAITGAADDGVRRLITKHLHGVLIPSDHYVVPVTGERACRYLL